MEEESKDSEAASAIAPQPTSALPATKPAPTAADLFNKFSAHIQQRKQLEKAAQAAAAKSSAPAPAASSAGRITIDSTCHCLVINDAVLAPNSADQHKFISLLSCKDTTSASAALLAWMPVLAGAGTFFARSDNVNRRVHVNFETAAGLARALLSSPLLIRCGSQRTSPWFRASHCCGKAKHEQPEMLQLTCTPKPGESTVDMERSIDALLQDMNFGYTVRWLGGRVPRAQRNDPHTSDPRIVINVLPRDIRVDSVRTLVNRLHDVHTLFGSAVHVQAPNIPELVRCRHCRGLGHPSDVCPLYTGHALRFLFKQPTSHWMVVRLQEQLQAKSGYLAARI